ncbi:MAG: FAD-dependent oxidoreductase [Candidatus Woesearchaeota archaeon]|nr:FAD-dependent oxidoreductase [Candidatus Woesearchaeota archaeon]
MKHFFDIVIVGGGFCGLLVAKQLEKQLPEKSIALIEPRTYFEYTPSITKVINDKDYASKITVSYASMLNRTVVINEQAKSLENNKIITQENTYSYRFAVICSGASYPCPLKDNKVFVLKSVADAQKIAKALPISKSVVIVGGGLVGVEVAGELCTKTDKKVILIEPNNRLLQRNSEKVSQYADSFLKSKNCNIVCGQRVVDFKQNIVFTNVGTKVYADIVIWCAGIGLDTVLKDTSCVNARGCIMVDENLRVKGLANVFAGGDITDVTEEKTAQAAEKHAKIISSNIIRNLQHKSLKKYKPHSKGLVISMGDWNAVFVWKNVCVSGWIPAILKKAIEWWTMRKIKK